MKSLSVALTIALAIFLFSCDKDLEEINQNPHGFTTASTGALFNGVIESMIPTWNEQFYINNEILYKQTQQAALTKEAWGNFTLGTEAMWSNYYAALPNIRELERRFTDPSTEYTGEVRNMHAMLKIVLAYKTFKLTDVFGDLPFFKAGYGFQDLEYLHPEFDKQRDIYFFLLNELRWADENISDTAIHKEPFLTFRAFDRLFNGDMLKWQKFANSLRLRHAMRLSEIEPDSAAGIISEIITNNRPVIKSYNFITYVGESVCLWPSAMGFKNESVNWSFREHNNLRMGSNIWHQLSAHDSIDGSGIFDPRAYIFFETDNTNRWVAFPQIPDITTPASGGIPYGTHRDQAGAFEIKGETCIYSPFNYFVIRDQDFMPIPIITGPEYHYILAEAYLRGIGFAPDPDLADIEYMNGINGSVEWWKDVAEGSKLPSSGMTFPEMIQIPQGLNASSVLMHFGSWNAQNDEEKLEFVYTQWWLDLFRNPQEAYALTRRTGKTAREGEPINHFRLPYPPSEVEYNGANVSKAISSQGGDSPEVKLWWIGNRISN